MSHPIITTAQFVGFEVVVTCKVCGDALPIPNDTPKRQMDSMLRKFNKQHEQAHKEEHA